MEPEIEAVIGGVRQMNQLTADWHVREAGSRGVASLNEAVEKLHALNFGLWHHEDQARRRDVPDSGVAAHKRNIDSLNAERNLVIEAIDSLVLERLARDRGRLQTETVGMLVDRLSILSLRMFHGQARAASEEQSRASIMMAQWSDLMAELVELLRDVHAGRRRFRVYRQFKALDVVRCTLFDGR